MGDGNDTAGEAYAEADPLDVWLFFYQRTAPDLLHEEAQCLMSAEERARCERLVFEEDRLLFAATRILVRRVLSCYADVSPDAWRFVIRPGGKPELERLPAMPALHFNVTNTPGLAACAVSRVHPRVGIDAECIARDIEVEGIAESFFSVAERAALDGLTGLEQKRLFYRYWTLKESYLKARGDGLALPLDRFSMQLDGVAPRVSFDASLADDADRWRFAEVAAGEKHLVSVAVDSAGARLTCRVRQWDPLTEAMRSR
ncbi:MAG TPA: 4'-phosphopantetheinyl transferase superfamily protein [Burkholderiaceae bacterium]|nr:4'-phosphopantetheinyl transferase superfamily protein [Burkholderiaceae bacterium]